MRTDGHKWEDAKERRVFERSSTSRLATDRIRKPQTEHQEQTMSYQAAVINVMIASPGDVPTERQIIHTCLHDWNALHAEAERMVLLPLSWQTHSTPSMEGRAQAVINRQVLDKGDLLIAVFWTRLGT